MIALRSYQDKWESDIRTAYANGAQSVLGVLPTGAGKTVVFSDMARRAVEKGNSVGIFGHRVEILDQIGSALEKFDVPHGYLAPGFSPNPMAPVQVCSIQAAARRIDRYVRNPFDFIILDEAHHAAAGTSFHAVVNAHRSRRILGVTATPQRLSGEPLSVAFDKMIVGPSTAELIRLGALTPYRLFAPSKPDMSGIARRGGDFAKVEAEGVMDRPTITGDVVAHYKRLATGKRAIVFCVSVAHAEHVAEQFVASGVSAKSIDGGMTRQVRKQVLASFSRGEISVLTSCDIVSEGFDVPAIEVAILLRPTESLALYLQQVGRALRPYPGKQFALILDHAGNSTEKALGGRGHGLPDDVRDWKLEGVKGLAKAGQKTMPTVICGKCFGVFRPAPCCPYCGHTRDIQGRVIDEIEGDLEEVDPDLVREARRLEQVALNKRIADAWDLPSLAKIASEQGYNAGWLWHRWKARGHPKFGYGEAVVAMKQAKKEMQDG